MSKSTRVKNGESLVVCRCCQGFSPTCTRLHRLTLKWGTRCPRKEVARRTPLWSRTFIHPKASLVGRVIILLSYLELGEMDDGKSSLWLKGKTAGGIVLGKVGRGISVLVKLFLSILYYFFEPGVGDGNWLRVDLGFIGVRATIRREISAAQCDRWHRIARPERNQG